MKLTAPKNASGTVMCSASGLNYDIDANGQITVEQRDVADLLRAGFTTGDEPLEAPAKPAATFSQEPAPGTDAKADAGTTGVAAE